MANEKGKGREHIRKIKAALPSPLRKKLEGIRKTDAEQLAGAFAMALMNQAASAKQVSPIDFLVNAGGLALMTAVAPHLEEETEIEETPKPRRKKNNEDDIIDAEFTVIDEGKK